MILCTYICMYLLGIIPIEILNKFVGESEANIR